MKRRQVLGAAALGALPLSAPAQTARPPGIIGYLHPRTVASDHSTLRILRQEWQRQGYVEGQSVLLRSADGNPQRLPQLARELAAQGAGVLIVVGAEAVRSVHQASTLPLVAIDLETDPVESGLATSFARPGGRLTGLFLDQPSLAGKWIELLQEAVPNLERVILLWDRATGRSQLDTALAVLRSRNLEPVVRELEQGRSVDDLLARPGGWPRTGMVVLTNPGFQLIVGPMSALAQKLRIPAIGFLRIYAAAGLVMTYGPATEGYYPRAVVQADRILRGAVPGNLPIELPTRYELVVNRQSARAMGLTLPATLLARADEVIG